MLEFFNSKHPQARKEYKCDLCNQKIKVGEKYHRYSGKYDGDMFDDKYHLTCQRIINAYCEKMNDNEYDEYCICDWLQDEYCLDCRCYEEDNCTFYPLTCPKIRQHYEKEGAK